MEPSQEFTYLTFNGLNLKGSFYRASENRRDCTILYFHGGGLIYGMRNDLPKVYRELFVGEGYDLVTFDYPLAPETSLPEIYECVQQAISWFKEKGRETLSIDPASFILFGRSAGAYLALLLASDPALPNPEKVISFYGYDSLKYQEFQTPSAHYQKFPEMPEALMKKMIGNQPVATGPLQTRYALYLYARQKGKWLEFLGATDDASIEAYSLSSEGLHRLPPVFLAQSDADDDVPYRIGKKLNQEIPDSFFCRISGMEHDFDRDTRSTQSIKAYEELIDWLAR